MVQSNLIKKTRSKLSRIIILFFFPFSIFKFFKVNFPSPEFNIIFEIFSAIAIMGVAADRARVDGGLYNYDTFLNETEIIYNNLDRVHLDFFIEMKRVDFDLEKIEDTVLANTVAVLRFTCSKDPLDYFGYGVYLL